MECGCRYERWKESGSRDVLRGEGVLALSIVFSSLSKGECCADDYWLVDTFTYACPALSNEDTLAMGEGEIGLNNVGSSTSSIN